jgi:hypothetical protein
MVPRLIADPWERLSALPVRVEACVFERRAAPATPDFERVTTLVRLQGAGVEGLGEDVSPFRDETQTLHHAQPRLPLIGEWTLGELCAHLATLEQWATPPEWDVARRWRNWAFESAALDLALNQAGRALHEVLEAEPRPVRFLNSLGLGDPPTFAPIRRRLEVHPDLRFKLDFTAAWPPELIAEVAGTNAVEIIDFKGRYGMEAPGLPELLAAYDRAIEAFPHALLEDGHDLPEVVERLTPQAHRISYDAPIQSSADLDTLPVAPVAVNVKPSRVGDLRTLFGLYAVCRERGLTMYGGGMGELDCGRGQIQLLASLFHPDGPNDTAPAGYNADTPAADLPDSPLPPNPAPTGFRRLLPQMP